MRPVLVAAGGVATAVVAGLVLSHDGGAVVVTGLALTAIAVGALIVASGTGRSTAGVAGLAAVLLALGTSTAVRHTTTASLVGGLAVAAAGVLAAGVAVRRRTGRQAGP